MRKIVYYPDKILRVKTEEIKTVDKQLLDDIQDLTLVLGKEQEHAAGLAAVQVGLNRRFFGLVVGRKRTLRIFVNPRIIKAYGEKSRPIMTYDDGGKESFLEGCLSFPNLFGTVKRFLTIDVQWQEVRGNSFETKTETLEGIEAIAFQHELDHLDGILFIDRIKEEKGDLFAWGGKKKERVDIDVVVNQEIKNEK